MPEEKRSTYSGQTEARRRASAKYLKEAVEDVRIRVPKGQKAVIKAHAESQGESMNDFVVRAIDEAIEQDAGKSSAKNSCAVNSVYAFSITQWVIEFDRLLFRQVCAFTAQTVRKRTGRKHPAHREAIGMAGCRYCSAEG